MCYTVVVLLSIVFQKVHLVVLFFFGFFFYLYDETVT